MRSKSSSFCVKPMRCTVNESAPRSDTMASLTAPLTPVMSATTVMIDATATMLPSSVSSERSLFAQIELSASFTDSRICDIRIRALQMQPRRHRGTEKNNLGFSCRFPRLLYFFRFSVSLCLCGVFWRLLLGSRRRLVQLHQIAVEQVPHG